MASKKELNDYVSFCLDQLDLSDDWGEAIRREVEITINTGYDIKELHSTILEIIDRDPSSSVLVADMFIMSSEGLGTMFWCWVMTNLANSPLFNAATFDEAYTSFKQTYQPQTNI